jgi:hypothetical protein
LLGATATNMAYMLSAQLVTMEFNVAYLGLSPSTMLNVGSGSALSSWSNNNQKGSLTGNLNPPPSLSGLGLVAPNSLGFISVQDLMNNAVKMLTNYGNVTASGAIRTYMEALKIVLDGANNAAAIFVQSTPPSFTYPY